MSLNSNLPQDSSFKFPQNTPVAEARRHPRLKLPAMYTLARIRPAGKHRFYLAGHVYDISLSGMRFELDNPLETGTQVTARVMLPGSIKQTTFEATGQIVRIHEDDIIDSDFPAGPTRMGLHFNSFNSPADAAALSDYLNASGLRAA